MKLPVPGFVSQALSSIINNDHRVKRTAFDKASGSRPNQKLKYKVVSDQEREKIVAEIMYKRKRRSLISALIVFATILAILLILYFK